MESIDTGLVSVQKAALKSRPPRSFLERGLIDQIGFFPFREGLQTLNTHRLRGGTPIETDDPEETLRFDLNGSSERPQLFLHSVP